MNLINGHEAWSLVMKKQGMVSRTHGSFEELGGYDGGSNDDEGQRVY